MYMLGLCDKIGALIGLAPKPAEGPAAQGASDTLQQPAPTSPQGPDSGGAAGKAKDQGGATKSSSTSGAEDAAPQWPGLVEAAVVLLNKAESMFRLCSV